jgi:hypothetical protein
MLPLSWLGAANVGAYFAYAKLMAKPDADALWSLTISSALPFGTLSRPALDQAIKTLFYDGAIPWAVQALAAGQGLFNVVMLFLAALALRNHFRVR